MTNLARTPESGRAWEGPPRSPLCTGAAEPETGFGGDPYLAGVATAETVRGIQSSGVAACVKHFVGNEQEHFRGSSNATASSSNIDDRTMRESPAVVDSAKVG